MAELTDDQRLLPSGSDDQRLPPSGSDDQRLLPSGDEAGSAPGDRSFRPDVEGLRAVAILLVVLYHAGIPGLSGGYVGVDVFFVISGYVITGVLLRERATRGATSLLGFYARRCRRILPAATLVLVCTVIAAQIFLGQASGLQTADDAKWAAVFLANFHFAAVGTNYLASQLPPSPLQNFWSLAVEEQFYLVFPTLFLIVAALRVRVPLRTRMLVVLGFVVVISLGWSIVQTASNPNAAYFSPFTRAWELALGSMVAFATPLLAKLRVPVATLVTWTGLGAITVAAFVFTAQTSYPGAYVALPVIGAAMVIAGGCAAPGRGAEWLLGTSPFRHLGRVSYSLYLWHWPILIIAAESQGQSSLSWTTNMAWLLVALLASIATYLCLENPIRRSRWLRPRSVVSILMGLGLVAVTLLVSTTESSGVAPATTTLRTASIASSATFATVESRVRTAPSIRAAPTDVQPPLGTSGNVGFPPTSACTPINYGQTTMRPCLFGDPQGEKSMVLYGDSHSAMWFQTIDDIATTAHWKLWYLGKSACPVELLPMMNPGSFGSFGGRFTQCDQWHSYAIAQINRLRPNLVIVTQEVHAAPGGVPYSSAQWREGLEHFFASITIPGVQFDVIGNIPQLPNDPVRCLAAHSQDVQVCSASRRTSTPPYQLAEAQAVQSVGGRYIDVTPWFCSTICTAVIGQDQVYFNQQHVMGTYATFLGGVMARALQLPISVDSRWRIPVAVSYPRPRASLRGAVVLVAAAGAPTGTKVEFILTGPGTHETVIAVAQPTLDGWISFWNSNEVPNGRYELRIVAHSENNGFGSSKAVPVTVVNSG